MSLKNAVLVRKKNPKILEKCLQKINGAKGDWKKEGYKIKHKLIKHKNLSEHDQRIFDDKLEISAYDRNGTKVGHLGLDPEEFKNKIMPRGVFVEDAHQRKGIASAMYDYAEKITGKKIVPQKGHQSPESLKFWENRVLGMINNSPLKRAKEATFDCLSSVIDILAANLTYQSIFDILGISDLLKEKYILTQKLPQKYIDIIINEIKSFLKNPLYKSLSLESEEDLKFLSENIAFKDYLANIFREIQKKLSQYEHRFLEFFNKYPEKSEISLEELKKSVKLDEISILFILDSLKNRHKIYDYNERKVTLN